MAFAAITRLTLADGLRQPFTWLTVAVGLVMLLLSALFGQFNFASADRIRLLMTAGVAATALSGAFLGLVAAAGSVHDELASRTAAALFAKPVSRASFIGGKALGIWLLVGIALLPLLLAHLGILGVVNTWGFDLRHRQFDPGPQGFEPLWTEVPWGRLLLAHVLTWLQAGVLISLGAGLACRLPLVAVVLVGFAVFVASHVLAGLGTQGAVLLPALGLLNVDEALQFPAIPLGPGYFLLCLVHTGLYSLGSLFLALGLFKYQDIP